MSFASRVVNHPRRLLRRLIGIERLHGRIDELETRVRQLVAAHETSEKAVARLRAAMQPFDPQRMHLHVARAVAAAPLLSDPFPHLVVDGLLPDAAYDRLVEAIPPTLFFAHLEPDHQEVMVPPELAPLISREVWTAFYQHAVIGALVAGLVEQFREPLDGLVRRYWPGHDSFDGSGIQRELLMSRILLRRPGYVIKPHRDPRWAFLTCLVYLPRRSARQFFGTELCAVRQERRASSHLALWMEDADVEVVKTIEGRPNTALAFVNDVGAHRASIPADVAADTERYLYQLQIGPSQESRRALLAAMSREQRAAWSR